MPIYEYGCLDCGKTFEAFQKMSDDPLTECRFCQGKVNRLISKCSFQLKGTGWYATDYKSSSSSTENNCKERKKSETAEASTETKTEEKKESKTESGKTETGGGPA